MKTKESNEIMNWVKKFEISQFIAIGANLKHIKSQLRPNDVQFNNLNEFDAFFENLNIYNHHVLLKGNNKSTTLRKLMKRLRPKNMKLFLK